MAFGNNTQKGSNAPLAEINMIPLIDVMLVLLVIFIVTAPLLTHSVKIDLPKASSNPNVTKPENIQLAIKADKAQSQLFWNGEPISAVELPQRFAATANRSPQPAVHIRADRMVQYEHVAKVMAAAAKTGHTRIGFVTEPEER